MLQQENKAQDIINEAQQILSQPADGLKPTGDGFRRVDSQVNTIIRIAKYKLHWTRSSIFSFMLETCPEYRKRLTDHEIKHSKTSALFQLMTSADKSLVIKRLDQIQKRNKTYKLNYKNRRKDL